MIAALWVLTDTFLTVRFTYADESKKEPAQEDGKKGEPPTAKPAEAKKEIATEGANTQEQKAAKSDEAKPEGKKLDDNPLTNFIKRSLQPGKKAAAEAAVPGPANGGTAKKPNRHAFDQRAPYDKRSDDWMRKAQAHIKAGEWKPAFELLQKISELPEDTLYRTDAGKWVSSRTEAQRLRGEAPPVFLEEYRVQFGGLARQLLSAALRTDDLSGIGRVAGMYFHTPAGYEAANRLGSLHLDRGEFALAAHWFAALWQAHTSVTKDVLWRAKAAFALKQAGQAELSRNVFDDSSVTASIGLGGESREPGKWLAMARSVAGLEEPALSDWPIFFGTPRRTGVATGGEPLLLPRWRIATTDSHPVRAQIEQLVEDLADQGTTPLPMLFPSMIDGKVVFRTLHGVQVVDAATGRPLWHTEESQPLERLIAGTTGQIENEVNVGLFPAMMGRGVRAWNNGITYGGAAGEYIPLSNLLFRNANFGIVSSDSRQLFVVDDPIFLTNLQPANPWAWNQSGSNLEQAAGRLTSYDLETGHPLWEIGGPANGEPFDLPLAGYFFFGAPVADGGELFVVGESTTGDSSGQIRLICLDPRSGEKKWSQLIAASESAIEKDIGRRWWTAQVASGDGILVCPTTVGWLTAVDRVTHSLLWGYRPAPQGPRNNLNQVGDNEATHMVPNTPLGGTWGPAPPIIAEGRVVYTPMDAPVLVCLDEFTGKELWSKPRGSSLYLAGVFDKLVVVVGRDAITAFHLEKGDQAWMAKITAPSGRGVIVAERLYLPLAAGEVWGINLKTGEILDKWSLPSHVSSVGNLAMYRGMLLSVDAFGLTAFEQRDAVQDEIARRKQQNSSDPWALLRQAEICMLARNLPEALAALRQIPRDEIPVDLRPVFHSLLVNVLTTTIRADFSRPDTETNLKDLAAISSTSDEKQELRRLHAELHVAQKEFEQAIEAYLALADDSQVFVARDDAMGVRVRSDLWAAGKLADLREAVPDAIREVIDRRIAALRVAAEGSDEARLKFVTLFRSHPEAVVVRRQLAESYAQRGDFLPAEQLLMQIARGPGPAAAEATARLARLMLEFKLPADAAYYYRQLEQRFGKEKVNIDATNDGQTGAQLVEGLRAAGKFPDSRPPVLDWHADSVRVERLGANSSNHLLQELSSLGSPVPFFRQHRFEVDPATQRLEVIDGLTDDLQWSLPLRNLANTTEGSLAVAQASGHHLTLLYRGVLHSLSPVDRKVLWTRPLDLRGQAQQPAGRNQMPLQPMQPAVNLVNRHAALHGMPGGSGSSLGPAGDEFVACLGRRNVTLLDALTGESCWTYTGVRPGTLTLGGEQVLYLRPADGLNPLALRASDGKRLDVKNLAETLNRAMHVVGDNFVLSGLAAGKPGLRLYDPLADKDLWTVEILKGTLMSTLDNNRMAVLESNGKFGVIDLSTGLRQELAALPPEDLKGRTEVYALADNVNIYLIINKGQNHNFYSEQVPFVRASGLVMAFESSTGKQRWKQAVHGQNLMLERLTFSPFLIFSSRKYEQKGKVPFWSLHLVAIDKLSGARLLDRQEAAQPGFRSITVSAVDRYVELRGWNERVRLYPVEKTAEAGQSGGE